MKYVRLLLFLIPVGLLFLSFYYKDLFYLLIAGVTFLFASLISMPKFLSNKRITFPVIKKRVHGGLANGTELNMENVIKDSFGKRESLILAGIPLLLFIVFFTYIGSHTLQIVPNIKPAILEYYVSQLLSLKQTWMYLLVLLFIVALLLPTIKLRGRSEKFIFRFRRSEFIKHLILTFSALIGAFILSFLTLYLYGIAQLNFGVIELNSSPNSVGVVYGKNDINNRLKSIDTAPKVVGTDSNPSNAILAAVINNNSNKYSYYQSRILKAIPQSLVMPFNVGNHPVVLVKNTLIIINIDKDTMQTISPTLAHLLLKEYFKNRDLKGNPTISVLNRQEYLAFRQDEINKQVAKIKIVIQKVEDYINSLYGNIANAKQKIGANQSAMQATASNEDYYYNNCINAGYADYFTGSFYHTYSQSYCDSIKSQAQSDIAQYQQNINSWNSTLQYDENELSQAQTADQNLKDYASSVDSSKNSTPDELGIFEGPSHVRVVLDSTSPKGINSFLETLVHENLHYQSYVSEDRNFQFTDGTYDGFWEEGLTEYFARKVIFTDQGVNINQGYPLLVKIVTQIAKKIPESELQKIYFTKDESTLEADLNAAYGTSFYKDTEPYFEYLSYLPPDRQVKYANDIMTRIGGKQFTQNDIYSTDLQQE